MSAGTLTEAEANAIALLQNSILCLLPKRFGSNPHAPALARMFADYTGTSFHKYLATIHPEAADVLTPSLCGEFGRAFCQDNNFSPKRFRHLLD